MNDSSLTTQIAVVTGAARGIGEAIALKLSSMGATVVLTARDQARLLQVKAAIEAQGGTAIVMACGLTDDRAIAALGQQVRTTCQRCDILVNNAGMSVPRTPLVDLPVEHWDQMMQTNLRAPYLMVKALAPMMIAARSGHIINISSLAGKNPLPEGAAYAASKWGLNGLTYSIAEELRTFNVRASVIAPGSVNTSFGSSGSGKDPGRMIQPEDVAAVVALLVTQPATSFISEVLLRPTMKP